MTKAYQNKFSVHGIPIAIIVVLCVITYLNSLPNQFVYDDTSTIAENRLIKDWGNFQTLFTHDYFKYSGELTYRPVVTLSYFIDYALWGTNPMGYHVVNVLLHTVNVILVYFLILLLFREYDKDTRGKRITSRTGIALLTCMFFAIHPIVSEVVNMISYREDLIATAFLIASFLFFLLYKERVVAQCSGIFGTNFHNLPQNEREMTGTFSQHEVIGHSSVLRSKNAVSLCAGSLVTYFFALLSKESAIVLPFLVFFFELLCNARAGAYSGVCQNVREYKGPPEMFDSKTQKLKRIFAKIPFSLPSRKGNFEGFPFHFFAGYIGISIIYLIIRFFILHNPGEKIAYPEDSFFVNMLTVTKVLGRYITSIFLPLNLNADYHVLYLKTPGSLSFVIPLFLLISIIAIWIRLRKKTTIESSHIFQNKRFMSGGERLVSNKLFDGKYHIMLFAMLWFFISVLPVMNIIPLANIMADRYLYLPILGFCLFLSIALAQLRIAIRYPVIIFLILFYMVITVNRNNVWRDEFTLWHKSSQSPLCSFTTYNNLGTQYNRNGYPDLALQCYNKALQKAKEVGFTKYATVYYNMGNAYEKKGLQCEAVQAYTKAIQMKPDYQQAHNNLGKVYFTLGQYEDALAAYNNALMIDPTFTYAYNNLGVLYNKLGRQDDAVVVYNKALSIDPHYGDAYYNLGNIYEVRMQYDLALDAYQKAIKADPKLVYVHNNLGTIYDRKGLLENAIAEYNQAIRLDPTYPYSYNNLGAVFSKKGDFDSALAEFRRAVDLFPNQPDFHFNLGYAYLQKDNYDAALKEFEVTLKIAPSHTEALFCIGDIYYRLGDKERATKSWQRVLEINPGHVRAKKCLEKLAGHK